MNMRIFVIALLSFGLGTALAEKPKIQAATPKLKEKNAKVRAIDTNFKMMQKMRKHADAINELAGPGGGFLGGVSAKTCKMFVQRVNMGARWPMQKVQFFAKKPTSNKKTWTAEVRCRKGANACVEIFANGTPGGSNQRQYNVYNGSSKAVKTIVHHGNALANLCRSKVKR
ncbi:MAG: hypothetical protein VX589_17905 [Myxococcota bacterium]|nr:hypothetical protein [Myxococcota bacterium]